MTTTQDPEYSVDSKQPGHRQWYSTRQRIVCLTFADPQDAEAWDAAGQPLEGLDGIDRSWGYAPL